MRTLALIIALSSVSLSSFGQKTVEELGELPDRKFFKDVFYETSVGDDLLWLLNKKRIRFEDLPKIEKVGLLSVFIIDDAYKRGRRGGVIYNHDEEENILSAGILETSLAGIEEILSDNEIELLESSEYLDDEEKKRAYRNFSFNYSTIAEARRFGEFFLRNEDSYATPEEYEMIYSTFAEGRPEEIVNSIGQLSSQLELDALLTVEIRTKTTNKSVVLESVSLVLHGAHPTLPDEGIFLGVGKYQPKIQVPFAEIEDMEIVQSRFDGFEPVISRLLLGLMEVVLGEIDSIE